MSKTSKSKVTCIVTGEVLGVRPDVYAARVAKAGSESELTRTYVSREAKQLLRAGETVNEIRAKFGVTDMEPVPQDVLSTLMSSWEGKKAPKKGTKKASKSVTEIEKEIEESTPVDPDVNEFLTLGETVIA